MERKFGQNPSLFASYSEESGAFKVPKTRILNCFAYLPRRIEGRWIWLRNFYAHQEERNDLFGCNDCFNPITPCDGHHPYWETIKLTLEGNSL